MKKPILSILFTILLICPLGAALASDFGDFFSGEAPMALGDGGYDDVEPFDFNDPANLFFDIEPAAGDFEPAIEEAVEKPSVKANKRRSEAHYRAPRITENNIYFVRKRSGE